MNISEIIYFLKTNIIGLVILGIISSIFANLIYNLVKKNIKHLNNRYKKRIFRKRLTKIALSFVYGSRFTYASKNSHFLQVVLIGDYIIDIVMNVGRILFTLLISIILILLTDFIFRWIIVTTASVIITFQYKKLKVILTHYNQGLEMELGAEYLEIEKRGYIEYWDKITGKKEVDRSSNNS